MTPALRYKRKEEEIMKRIIWSAALSVVAIVASVAPTPASGSDPCYTHECHNGYDCPST